MFVHEKSSASSASTTRASARPPAMVPAYRQPVISDAQELIAELDVLLCFAAVALSAPEPYVRPKLVAPEDGAQRIVFEGLRHPCVERMEGVSFIKNGVSLVGGESTLQVVTGPNMGGKSTYLRTVALVSVLAQAGCFVPASNAKIGLVDRIFTRVGASDDLKRGRSTFMMEMIEVAHIIKRATNRSLVLLDEIGRGTSTFDGLSIAWSVTEDICSRIGARTMFATHYHQLIGLEEEIDGLCNVHVQVAHTDGQLRFLHSVADGPCDDSYGVQVAALAGLPRNVVERATDLLAFLEHQAGGARAGEQGAPQSRAAGQASLMGYFAAAAMKTKASSAPAAPVEEQKALERLRTTQVDELSPRQALDVLYALKQDLEDVP